MQLRAFIFFLAVTFLGSTAQAAINCQDPTYTCVNNGSVTTGGIVLTGFCEEETGSQACVDTAPLDECRGLKASLKCDKTAETCVDWENGACRQTRKDFTCLNENTNMAPARLVNTVFGPIQESFEDQCGPLANDPECSFRETVTTEGEETRDINRKMVYRAWWRRQSTYECLTGTEGGNNCQDLNADPNCTLVDTTCLNTALSGSCINREFHYRCGTTSTDFDATCTPINVCVGGTCLGVTPEPNEDFGMAAAWLNILEEMVSDFRTSHGDPFTVEFFKSTPLSCSVAPTRNCCQLDGIAVDLAGCPESAELLAESRLAGSTHYVGTYCQDSLFGACIRRRYVYCKHNTKFGRVFAEDVKDFFNVNWGTATGPNCGSLTLEQIATVDIDAIDLSEVFGDTLAEITVPAQQDIADYLDRFSVDIDPMDGIIP